MKIPLATYRLQFNPQFDFAAAGKIIDYLSALGITDIYASPIFKARKGSQHGYDVVDDSLINPELGGLDGFNGLIEQAHAKQLGWLQDIVPNHMAYDSDNKMLMDIFENGPYSEFFNYFDVQFNHPYEHLQNKILAPFLGEFYGNCLDKGQIQIRFTEAGFAAKYYDWVFPLRLDSYLTLLIHDLPGLTERLGQGHENLLKFMELTQMLKEAIAISDPQERSRQSILIKSRLWNMYCFNEVIQEYIKAVLNKINGKVSDPQSFNELDRLLSDQFFRLAFWKVGNEELNYRRFFTINGFVCLNMDQAKVFEYTHRLVFQLMAEKKIDGLRIDHIDGLSNPAAYLKTLKEKMPDHYVIVEKILDLQENLPIEFHIEGTTGYDFLNFASELLVERKNEKKMDQIFREFTGNRYSYEELILDKKQHFIGRHMAGDIDNLAQMLRHLLNRNRYGRDLTAYGLKRALVEIMAQFPVYRTYMEGDHISDTDKIVIKEALARSRNSNPGASYELDAVEKVLLLNFDTDITPDEKTEWMTFIKRFQQFTGPLTAKALEDTTFYIYNRLTSLNEVGGNPSVFGLSPKEVHDFNARRAKDFPNTMNATSTHDTKRGEDMRSRINVLSEIPEEWAEQIKSWAKINQTKKQTHKNIQAPNSEDEYFIYQTLVGAFPFNDADVEGFQQRMEQYIVKAIREAKVRTAWIKPDLEYEQICVNFIKTLLQGKEKNEFLEAFKPFQKKIAHYGIINSLSQVLLKLTSPGLPDFYQGSELWDLSLVDPDNRRPVDYEQRINYLELIETKANKPIALIQELYKNKEDGCLKLFLIHRILALRNQWKDVFQKGDYIPLEVQGELQNNIFAFGRQYNGQKIITVVPRFSTQILKDGEFTAHPLVWKDTRVILPSDWPLKWRDALTKQEVSSQDGLPMASLLQQFPVACLIVSP